MSYYIKNPYLLFSILFGILSIYLNFSFKRPLLKVSKEESALNLNYQYLNFFNVGQKRLMADILWIVTHIESDLEHYKGDPLNSWMYLRFSTISHLDPQFIDVYQKGGLYLSVIKDDKEGAKELFLRGLEVYPQDYWLNFYGGYHFYFELAEYHKGIELFQNILTDKKAPSYLGRLLARMKASTGDLQSAFMILSSLYSKMNEDNPIKKELKNSLYAIRAELDLTCLNSSSRNLNKKCNEHDLLGNKYLINNKNEYYSAEKWRPFRVKRPLRNIGSEKSKE